MNARFPISIVTLCAIAFLASSVGQKLDAQDAGEIDPKCLDFGPVARYKVFASDYLPGNCGPVRQLHLETSGPETSKAILNFWEHNGACGCPSIVVSPEEGLVRVNLLLKDFDVMYDILKSEKSVSLVGMCDGAGGYRAIHLLGRSE